MRTELDGGILTLCPEVRVGFQNAGEFEECVLMKLMKRIGRRPLATNAAPEVYEILDVTGFTDLMGAKGCLREISVMGCELICRGDFGKVYRIDDEQAVVSSVVRQCLLPAAENLTPLGF